MTAEVKISELPEAIVPLSGTELLPVVQSNITRKVAASALMPVVAAGTTTTGLPGTDASVVNSGSGINAVFDFTIPRGDKGDTGATGTGTAATVDVGTTTTGAAGTSATVVNSGTTSAAVFDFTIPQGIKGDTGDTGDTGATGAAATVAAGTTTTGAAGSSAAVVNSGTSAAAVFDFTIPQGIKGDTGDTGSQGVPGINWLGTWSGVTTYALRDAVAYNGSSYYAIAGNTNQAPPNVTYWNILALKGVDGSGSGDVNGPALATDNAITRFDTTTGKLIQNSVVTISDAGTESGIEALQFQMNPVNIPTTEGSMYWDNADGNQTLSLVMAGGTATQQIGEEQYYRIKASSAITNGQVVMFTGSVGASGGLTGAPSTGLIASTAGYIIGIATQNMALNDWGYVTSFGLVRNLNTSAWLAGTILYYDPTVIGGLTATLPIAPNAKVQVAAVVYSSTTVGSLFVRTTFGGVLGQYEGDVQITLPATNDLIHYDAGGYWRNIPVPTWNQNTTGTASNVTGTVAVANGGTGATSLTLNNVLLGNGTSAVQVVAPGTSGNVLTSNGTIWSSTTPAAGVSLSAANTWTATQTFNGSSSTFGTVLLDSAETVNIVAAAPAATTNLYVQSGSVQYYTSNAANNFIVNIAFSAGTTMNAALAIGQVETAALITTQNATAYYGTAVYVDGTATGVTTKWIGGAPTAGNASGLDTYRFAVIKTASATYTVLASLTQYK